MPCTRTWLTAGILLALTVVAYLPLWDNNYIDFDDGVYVTENPRVTEGITARGFTWAWTTLHGNYWQPVSWLSLQIDAQFFSTSSAEPPLPAAVHGENLGWHAASVLLLFGLLYRLTGAWWRSCLVAALFAVHPLHVESVAWAAERKDVLSVFFGLLTLWAYVRRAAAPGPLRYAVLVAAYTLSLLSKPMLMTLPFLLLLLDYWPLGRLGTGTAAAAAVPLGRLVLEKVPLFLLAAASAVATAVARAETGVAVSLATLPLSARLANAATAYGWYLSHTVWPRDLAVLYPHPEDHWRVLPALAGAAALLGGTLVSLWQVRRRRWLAVGWFWFVGALLPVIGLAQGGAQAWADRFVYWPHVGLFVAVVWGLGEWAARWRIPVAATGTAAALLLAALAALTWTQVGYWHDPVTLWERARAVTTGNYFACTHLANHYLKCQRPDLAVEQGAEAVRIRPDAPELRYSQGVALLALGREEEAVEEFRETVLRSPACADAWHNLGIARLRQGQPERAARAFGKALTLQPGSADTLAGLGQALWRIGKRPEALRAFQDALESNPQSAGAWNGLGVAYLTQERPQQAIQAFSRALQFDPGMVSAHSNLGVALGRAGWWAEAVASHLRAVAMQEQGEERLQALKGHAPAPEMIPQLVIYQCRLAFALDQLGDRQAADRVYRAALLRDPDWPHEFTARARQLAADPDENRRDPPLACEMAEQAARAGGGGSSVPPALSTAAALGHSH